MCIRDSNQTYRIEFWATTRTTDKYAIGLFFGKNRLDVEECGMLELPAQITFEETIHQNEWKKLIFEFKPRASYTYFTVGNFQKTKLEKRQYLFFDNFLIAKKIPESKPFKKEENAVIVEEIFNPRNILFETGKHCLLYTSPSPRDRQKSRMPSSA